MRTAAVGRESWRHTGGLLQAPTRSAAGGGHVEPNANFLDAALVRLGLPRRHGVQVGVERGDGQNLRTATTELIQGLRQGNPRIRQSGQFSNVTIAGRPGLSTLLSNVSDATGQQERIALYTAQLRDGSLFYVVGVAPASEFQRYQPVFNQVVRSIELNDTVRNSSY